MKILMVLFFLFLFSETSFAQTVDVVAIAREEGSKVGYEREILGILKQESDNGMHPRVLAKKCSDNDDSCGNMQVSISTAKFVIEDLLHMEKMTNSQIKRELINNDRLNIQIGSAYYKYLVDSLKDRDLAILAYNVGIGNVIKHGTRFDPNNYLKSVKRHMKNSTIISEKVEIAKKYEFDLVFSKSYGLWLLTNKKLLVRRLIPNLEKMSDADFENFLIKEYRFKTIDNAIKNV